jgi:hypothetical protein
MWLIRGVVAKGVFERGAPEPLDMIEETYNIYSGA